MYDGMHPEWETDNADVLVLGRNHLQNATHLLTKIRSMKPKGLEGKINRNNCGITV